MFAAVILFLENLDKKNSKLLKMLSIALTTIPRTSYVEKSKGTVDKL